MFTIWDPSKILTMTFTFSPFDPKVNRIHTFYNSPGRKRKEKCLFVFWLEGYEHCMQREESSIELDGAVCVWGPSGSPETERII